MSTLIYSPLHAPASTRLVHLHPGSDADPLTCDLIEADLDTLPTYEAVSYTWGDASNQRTIVINGTSISIRANLYLSLVRLRDRTLEKVLWIDALSISQADLDEKARQVAMIGRIFKQAQRVRVWVGEHADGSESLFRVTDPGAEKNAAAGLSKRTRWAIVSKRLQHMIFGVVVFAGLVIGTLAGGLISWKKGIDTGVPVGVAIALFYTITFAAFLMFSFPISKREVSFRTMPQWRCFVDRLYFRRLWVTQEIALAQSVVVHCGDDAKEWSDLFNNYLECDGESSFATSNALLTPNHWRRPTDGEVVFLNALRQTGSRALRTGPKTIGELVFETRHAECEDQRDRIYALLSLENQNQGQNTAETAIIPDYRISIPELFVEVHRKRGLFTPGSYREVMMLIDGLRVTPQQARGIWQLLKSTSERVLFALSYLGYLFRSATVPANYEFTYSASSLQ
jgi:hypothetical protein